MPSAATLPFPGAAMKTLRFSLVLLALAAATGCTATATEPTVTAERAPRLDGNGYSGTGNDVPPPPDTINP